MWHLNHSLDLAMCVNETITTIYIYSIIYAGRYFTGKLDLKNIGNGDCGYISRCSNNTLR